MVITREWIINFIRTRIKSHPVTPVSAMSVRDVLEKMIDYVDDGTGGGSTGNYVLVEIGLMNQTWIKFPGNVESYPEEGDWLMKIDADTKNLQKFKRREGVWQLVEEDSF